MRLTLACAATLLLACTASFAAAAPAVGAPAPAAPAPAAPAPGAAGPAPTPPVLRLGDEVRPVRQAATLEVIPDSETFNGETDIAIEVRKSTPLIWLNGTELNIHEARLSVGGKTIPAKVIPGGAQCIGFAFDEPLAPGQASLHIEYDGPISRIETEGLFAQKEREDWYAYSQFEAISARRVIPCFDEPGFKIPWKISLRVRTADTALSNTPMLVEEDRGDGMKTVRFAETQPLPSYLVAFAVGPFDVVDAGKAGRKPTQIRIFTPRGSAASAKWAAETTPKILLQLENYFDMAYPYEKLDEVAMPTTSFAMENPGLVTYGQRFLLRKPEEDTIRFRRLYISFCAHELAHQWFGDLVTLAWWNDTWLNESFASWLGDKMMDEFEPAWDVPVSVVESRSRVLNGDVLSTARRIHQPIVTIDDIENSFDRITYDKGQAVLDMFESYMGEEAFRKGVRLYIRSHAGSTATASEFLSALSTGSGHDVTAAFTTFLDQTGAPQVTANLVCTEGKAPKLAISQRPFRTFGSKADTKASWQVPVCARYGLNGGSHSACTMLTGESAELALGEAAGCPSWVFANEGESGYYLLSSSGEPIGPLLTDASGPLTLPERVGILGDLGLLMNSGEVPPAELLALMPQLASDPSRQIIGTTIDRVESVDEMVPAGLRPRYAGFVRDLYGARAQSLGWKARPGEDDDTRLLRPQVISIVGIQGDDPALAKQAAALARKWFSDPQAIDPDMTDLALSIAARNGDGALFDRLKKEAKTSKERTRRRLAYSALGSFRDPKLAKKALELTLDEGYEARESLTILFSLSGDPATRQMTYDFMKEHFDQLLKRLPRDSGAFMPRLSRDFCDAAHREDAAAFFGPRTTKFTGGPRTLDQTLERIDQCIARRAVLQPSVASFLNGYSGTAVAARTH